VITLRSVHRTYETPAGSFPALAGVDLDVAPGELLVIVGRSGSGKSTLLHLVGGIDRPTSGTVDVGGVSLRDLSTDRLSAWRGKNVGIVFQFFQLLPALSVEENVMLPMDFAGTVPAARRRERARDLLARVGVADQARKRPAELSGGQQQRVAIARALANDPPLLLADEPTGNLDSATSAEIFALFGSLAVSGNTVVIVTHEPGALPGATRMVTLADGVVVA